VILTNAITHRISQGVSHGKSSAAFPVFFCIDSRNSSSTAGGVCIKICKGGRLCKDSLTVRVKRSSQMLSSPVKVSQHSRVAYIMSQDKITADSAPCESSRVYHFLSLRGRDISNICQKRQRGWCGRSAFVLP